MATEYYDHPLEVHPQTGKGFQATADYDGTHESASHYGHTTVVSMIPHSAKPGEFFDTTKKDTEVSKARLALQYSLGYVLMTGITVGRHWAVVLSPKVVSGKNSFLMSCRRRQRKTDNLAPAKVVEVLAQGGAQRIVHLVLLCAIPLRIESLGDLQRLVP
jgi:hypothetical protein